jgi:Fe-S cluster biogenesis protein NfuA
MARIKAGTGPFFLRETFGMTEKSNQTVTARVQQVIENIKPLLQADGGDIELVSVDEQSGVVSVRLQGACRGCPGAAITLKMGVERHMKEKVPEVTEVVAVQ